MVNQPPAATLVVDVLERYLARHGRNIPSKDVAKRAVALWVEFWKLRTVADMTVDAQEEFIAWLRGKGYSEGYVRRVLAVGKAALNRAWKRQEVTEVPWVELPPISDPYPHTASLDQLAAFLNAVPEDSHLWIYCIIRLTTGCRDDAARDLQPFQIDWTANLIRLNPEGRQQTKKYRPVVPLTATLRQALQGVDAAYYVNWHGKHIGSIKKAWAKVRKDARLPEWFAPKVLRHTVATELRRRGVPHWEVSGQIGHKRAGTSEIYAKFDPDYLGAARTALDAWMDDLARKVPRLRGQSGVSHMRKVVGGTRIELVTPTMSRLGKMPKIKD